MVSQPDWQRDAEKKRWAILSAIPDQWILNRAKIEKAHSLKDITGFIEELMDEENRRITRLDTGQLLGSLLANSLTAVKVVNAFCKRTAFAHQLNNNVLDISIEGALRRAAELDQFYVQNGRPIGPLHGLPVTFKDQFHVKGMDTTMGYVGWIGSFEGRRDSNLTGTVESEVVRQLVSLGAVPIAKTSVVQTLWYGETANNILGYTYNPCNQSLSSGGSSGGQAALQALRGSTIGFGTDIGGSVSIPAAFNGLFSIKPSTGRISFRNVANSSPGQQTIPTTVGIFGVSISCLQTVFRSLQTTQPWLHDPDVVEIPWRTSHEIRRDGQMAQTLSFGLFANDGMVTPHPPIQRAMRMVEKALRNQGHELIPWCPPSHAEASKLLHCFTGADGGWDVFKNIALSGEPLIRQLRDDFGSKADPPMGLIEYQQCTLGLKRYRRKYQDYWATTSKYTKTGRPVDAVILPVAPHAAVIPGYWFHYKYGSIANVLDYTTVVIPVTRAKKCRDRFDWDYRPMNEVDERNWLAYNPEIYDGAPAAVQILGRRFDEERLLSIAQLVTDALASIEPCEGYESK